MQSAIDEPSHVNLRLTGRGRTGEIHQVLHDLCGPARLLVQHPELFRASFVSLAVFQQFAHAEYCGERIVQFVGKSSKHLAHRGEALALDDLFFELLLNRDVADGDDYAAQVVFSIEKLAGRGAHRAPGSVAVSGPVFRRAE